jgi:hypothetical protein
MEALAANPAMQAARVAHDLIWGANYTIERSARR